MMGTMDGPVTSHRPLNVFTRAGHFVIHSDVLCSTPGSGQDAIFVYTLFLVEISFPLAHIASE
jgi:hypothetical protein